VGLTLIYGCYGAFDILININISVILELKSIVESILILFVQIT